MLTKSILLAYRQLEEAIGTISDLIYILGSQPILSHPDEYLLSR